MLNTTHTQTLIASLQVEHEPTRLLAAQMLVEMGEAAVEPLMAVLRDKRGNAWALAASVLVKIGEPAVGPLIDALFDENEQVRILAAGALGQIGNARAVQPILHILQQEQEQVRLLMVWTLVKIGRAAVESLIMALRNPATSVQSAAAWALGEIGDERGIKPLKELQTSADSQLQGVVNEALRKLSSKPSRAMKMQSYDYRRRAV